MLGGEGRGEKGGRGEKEGRGGGGEGEEEERYHSGTHSNNGLWCNHDLY